MSEIKEENIHRILEFCNDREQLCHYMDLLLSDLREKRIKYETTGDIVVYKTGRMKITKVMFLTVNEERKIVGRHYNELNVRGTSKENPRFDKFMEVVSSFKIPQLFTI